MHKPGDTALKSRTGAQLLVDALAANGLTQAFGVPGESYLAVLDALYQSPVDFIVCRQEGGAAMMAEAVGKVTGRPGVCFVTRGPGATNASAGVHVAQQDSTPMLLFVGQVARKFRGREAFQEVDFEKFFAPLAKWAVEIDDPARVPEIVARAIRVTTQGRPGPVVISLPEDMLTEHATVADAPVVEPAEVYLSEPVLLETDHVVPADEPQMGLSRIPVSITLTKLPRPDPFDRADPADEPVCVSYPVAPGSYRISSGYGYRIHPIFGSYTMHMGVDYAAPLGTPIHAVTDGTVVYTGAGRLGRSSELVIIEHTVQDTTFYSWYVHMYPDGVFVEVGQRDVEWRCTDRVAHGRREHPHPVAGEDEHVLGLLADHDDVHMSIALQIIDAQ